MGFAFPCVKTLQFHLFPKSKIWVLKLQTSSGYGSSPPGAPRRGRQKAWALGGGLRTAVLVGWELGLFHRAWSSWSERPPGWSGDGWEAQQLPCGLECSLVLASVAQPYCGLPECRGQEAQGQ